jgi:hypothetical protein
VNAEQVAALRIVVDANEALPQHRGYRFPGDQLLTLDCADYSAADCMDILRIERKSLPDLLNCCGARRGEFEVGTLAAMQVYPHRFLVIEATLQQLAAGGWARPRVHPSAAIGSVFGWALKFGVHPIFAGDAAHARAAIIRIVSLVTRYASTSGQARHAAEPAEPAGDVQ